MALANFLDKAALNAAQILNNYDRTEFETTLIHTEIAIVFGQNAALTHEGRSALDMLMRLLARLYPNICVIDLTENKKQESVLKTIAKSINPQINFAHDNPNIYIAVGDVNYDFNNACTFFIGASGWAAKFSTRQTLEFGSSKNPFGGGCAACFAAANIFRQVFKDQLPHGQLDSDFSFSALRFIKNPDSLEEVNLDKVYIKKMSLFGVGAIGNGFLWALKNTPELAGQLNVIDGQKIDLSNLQRYVLTTQDDIEKWNVDLGKKLFDGSAIEVTEFRGTLQEYFSEKQNWEIDTAAVCVDSVEDRMALQASLPKKIFNAWTQHEDIGVSRHLNFLTASCLCCLYLPETKKLNRSEEIATNLNLNTPQHERIIREYLATGKPVDRGLINLICSQNRIEPVVLSQFEGASLEVF